MSKSDHHISTMHDPVDHDRANGRPPTAADVARVARVSRSTVSLVLNQVPDSRIPQETRARVRAAAEQLGYVPHAAASALRGGHNNLVLIPYFNRPHSHAYNVYYDAMAGRLTELGYIVMLHRDRVASGPDVVKQWASLRPVGVILESHRLDDQARDVLQKAGTRAILAADAMVANPQAQGTIGKEGARVAEHLIATGHRSLGAVVPRDPTIQWLGLRRLKGVAQVAQTHGVPVARIDLALDGQEAVVLAQRWRTQPHPTGVFAYNDEYAMLLLSALHKAGVAIPGDVAVIGCDNLPLCDFLIPPLTSITLHPEVSGRGQADRFHAMILGLPLPPTDPVEPTLILRESA